MNEKVYRCFVEKKQGFNVAARALEAELAELMALAGLRFRFFNRYDVQNVSEGDWPRVMSCVLSEPMCDDCHEERLPKLSGEVKLLCVEALPGQFDVRADSCAQCVQMLLGGERPNVRAARVYAIEGVDDAAFERIKAYLINPVECCEASMDKPETLQARDRRQVGDIPVIEGFTTLDEAGLGELLKSLSLAMSLEDMLEIRACFREENRDPTLAELRVIDTYWSDHCRHVTFNTLIEAVEIEDPRVKKAYDLFLEINGERPVTLMGMATAAMRHLRASGKLPMLDESEENNACTIRVRAKSGDTLEDWLVFFKNETHNHPTEIEPFGGAATCVGGAIRDPLSGRAYVYQSMRITGAGDPRRPLNETLPGKLPQRKLTVDAASGFSSYGNQIGIATGLVKELYHDGYVAKRLETGAVVGAAPASSVVRESPEPGDVVVLLGGRTGRDGIGGATGSSKTHGAETVAECASEVQKGNAPEERKLQRLFRNPEVTRLIKRCNDFGAGGAAVAIGELADGVEIDLDAMPVKYDGLSGTELAISESQERMAAVAADCNLDALLRHAEAENIEASSVAIITKARRLVMKWRGQKIVDIKRDFLDTNGAERRARVYVPPMPQKKREQDGGTNAPRPLSLAGELSFCSQKGLAERFDNSIGASSVFMPFGGKYALTETQVMAATLPEKDMRTATVMAYGFDPHLTQRDPFGGSVSAVVGAVAKLVASGAALDTIHLSLQEYFPRTGDDPARWGLPFCAMLGAFAAQMGLGIAAIGGKDSMSGSFGEMDVPPTLIAFALGIGDAKSLISPEFKAAGHRVYLMEAPVGPDSLPDFAALRRIWVRYGELCQSKKALSGWAVETGGVLGGIMKMALGNMVGFAALPGELLEAGPGSILFEADGDLEGIEGCRLIGHTTAAPDLALGDEHVPLLELRAAWEAPLEGVFPTKTKQVGQAPIILCASRPSKRKCVPIARPKAVIPVFPGTNCEYDTASAIERAGGVGEIVLVRNLTPRVLDESVAELERAIVGAQMIVFPGGFSGADEPDGSGKYIVSLFRNQRLTDAVHSLLFERDGLILGICNGFQALVKLGLLPYGRITKLTDQSPTLTFNRIGRHQSRYVTARVASVNSPWLSRCTPGELYVQPVSHGEGRFVASEAVLETMKAAGQIAFQYADHEGMPSMDIEHNPNGSVWAIEGISSGDGRVLGKMAHTERCGDHVAKNIPGNKVMPLFEGGVDYFR